MIEDDPAEIARRLARAKVADIKGLAVEDQQRALSDSDWYTRPSASTSTRPTRPRAHAKDGKHELPRERFFARLRAFEIACPRCGWLWTTRHAAKHQESAPAARTATDTPKAVKRRLWDPRTHVWRCRRCNLRLQLGLVAYVAPMRLGDTYAPEDTIPTLAEARALAAAGAPVPGDPPAPPLAARALELAAETGEPLGLVLERLEKAARGKAWRAWGTALRGELTRESLPKGKRVNKLTR